MGYVPHFCPILTQNPLDHEAFQILPHSFRWANIGYLNALQHGVRSPFLAPLLFVPNPRGQEFLEFLPLLREFLRAPLLLTAEPTL